MQLHAMQFTYQLSEVKCIRVLEPFLQTPRLSISAGKNVAQCIRYVLVVIINNLIKLMITVNNFDALHEWNWIKVKTLRTSSTKIYYFWFCYYFSVHMSSINLIVKEIVPRSVDKRKNVAIYISSDNIRQDLRHI